MKNLLVLSHVLPFPGHSGQQQRVKNKLRSLNRTFDVTFVTFGDSDRKSEIEKHMSGLCDKVICLPSKYSRNSLNKAFYRGLASLNALKSGLKPSNFIIGDLEFTPESLSQVVNESEFDCVLFEYWHAFKSAEFFREKGIRCVLDMHNILSQSYLVRQNEKAMISKQWARNQLRKYTEKEESAWKEFDGIIAINREELEYVKKRVPGECEIFYTPMGINLENWQMAWAPSKAPVSVGYYGGLGSEQNQQSALFCFESIMPSVWQKFPTAELWIIGSNPPDSISKLGEEDPRVKVTGYIEDPKPVLSKMNTVVCPWKGKYGFRSRLIEVMALGVPVVTTTDAVYGMELNHEKGVLLAEENDQLKQKVLKLLLDEEYASQQSQLARREVEKLYSFENTYDKLSADLLEWLEN